MKLRLVTALIFASLFTESRAQSTQPATVVVSASVAAFYSVDLYAKDSGYLAEVKADIGDHVKKGDVLAVIDDPELAEQLASAEAVLAAKKQQAKASDAGVLQAKAALDVAKHQLASFEADRELAQATLKRQEELFKDKAATSQQIDEARAKAQVAASAADVGRAKIASAEADVTAAEAARAVAAAAVDVANADVKRTRTLLGYTKVVAPFDGVITRRLASPGDLVQSAATNRTAPLYTCQKLDVVRVLCDVPESSASNVRAGTVAEIKLTATVSSKPISATVTRVSGAVDPPTRTMRVEIDLPNVDEALRPGMYAQVTLTPKPSRGVAEAAGARK